MNNNLLINHKELMDEYNHEKNDNIDLENITLGSTKKIWWLGKCGHEWEASLNSRSRGTGCPYCSNRKILVGYNDLATTNKEMLNEWNYDRNGNKKPENYNNGSACKVWWKCKCGHEWEDEIRGRIKGNGCPYCSGHRVCIGFNDLKTTHPLLIKEWDYEKNGDKKPEDFSSGSRAKIWWKCEYGHSWESTIYHRTGNRGCPICNNTRQTSFAEQSIYYYLSKQYSNIINRYKEIFDNGMEIDIFLPDQKIGIEYDGKYYHKGHKSKNREKIKYEICKSNNIKLIRIKEDGYSDLAIADLIINCKWSTGKYEDLNNALIELFDYMNIKIDVDTKQDKYNIMALYKSNLKNNSLAKFNPLVAKEWNYEKNNGLTPEMFTPSSGVSVWWKCKYGHEWKAAINKRNNKQNCPYCSNHRIIVGDNDFASNYPKLLEEWNYEKNIINPFKVSFGSSKKVHWKCKKCNHEWEATIVKRTSSGQGCPYCNSKAIRINQYTQDGKFIKQFNSCVEAGKSVGVSHGAIKYACQNKSLTKGFQWRFDEGSVNRIEKYVNKNKHMRRIEQYDLNGNYISTFDSITSAMEKTGAKKICEVCNGKRKSSGGFIWKYK